MRSFSALIGTILVLVIIYNTGKHQGGKTLGTAERRNRIMKILCRKRYETISNLAHEFSVSERTIRRDIETMSLTEPIYTQTGRYCGGVYVMDGYWMERMYMDASESMVLNKLCKYAETNNIDILSTEELNILKNVIKDYSKPGVNHEKRRNKII